MVEGQTPDGSPFQGIPATQAVTEKPEELGDMSPLGPAVTLTTESVTNKLPADISFITLSFCCCGDTDCCLV